MRGEPTPPFFKDITVTRVIGNDSRSETHRIGVVGGSVSDLPGGINEARTWHRVVWDDQTLVFEHETATGSTRASGDWTSRREDWSFDSGGRLQVVIATRISVDAPRTAVAVYRRQ